MVMPAFNKTIIRNLTILLGSALSVLTVTILAPALPRMLAAFNDVPNSELLVRLVLTTPALFVAIGAPFSGFLLDRIGRKPVILVALVIYAFSGTAGFYLGSIYGILLSRAILGLSISAIMSGFTTLIIDYFKGADLDRFMGYQSAFISFGGMGFIFIGGLLADVNWRLVFLVHLLAAIVLILTAFVVNEPARKKSIKGRSSRYDKPAIPYKTIGLIYLTTFISILIFFIFPLQVPFHLSESSASLVGLALSVQGLVGAMIALQYGRIKRFLSFYAIFAIIFIFFGINHIILSFAEGYVYIVTALIFGGLGIGLLPANINVWLASVVPNDVRGKAVGGLTMSLFLGQFLTPIISQPVLVFLGIRGMFLAFGIASLFIFTLFALMSLKYRRQSISQ